MNLQLIRSCSIQLDIIHTPTQTMLIRIQSQLLMSGQQFAVILQHRPVVQQSCSVSLQDMPDIRRIKKSQQWLPRYLHQHIYVPLLYGLVRKSDIKRLELHQLYVHCVSCSILGRQGFKISSCCLFYTRMVQHLIIRLFSCKRSCHMKETFV